MKASRQSVMASTGGSDGSFRTEDVYPILVVAYRATGIHASDRALLELGRQGQAGLPILRNRELEADGEVHELVLDLRDDATAHAGDFTLLTVRTCCQGPEPVVFDLLGLRFESDHQFPPLEQTEEAQFAIQAVQRDGKPVAGATVTADPDWLNLARTATTDAEGKATLAVPDTFLPDDGSHPASRDREAS